MEIRKFPNEVFARLAPDIYFERHFENNSRPTGRKFLEARTISVKEGPEDTFTGSYGTSFVRAGNASLACGITLGTTEFAGEGGVYVNAEIPRGLNSSVPSGEDQICSYNLQKLLRVVNDVRENFVITENLELCLQAKIVVLSRSGPSLDLAWECLYAALRNTRIPLFEQDERSLEYVPTAETKPLIIPETVPAHLHTYGLYGNKVFADIDGPIEEEAIVDRICVARTADGQINGISLDAVNGCTVQDVRKVLKHDSSLYA